MLQHILSFADGVPTSERMEFDLGDGTAAPPRINRLRLVSKAWDVAFRQSVCALRVFCDVEHFEPQRFVALYPALQSLEIAVLRRYDSEGRAVYDRGGEGRPRSESLARAVHVLQVKPFKRLVLGSVIGTEWVKAQTKVESFRLKDDAGLDSNWNESQLNVLAGWLAGPTLRQVNLGYLDDLDDVLEPALCVSGLLEDVNCANFDSDKNELISQSNDLIILRADQKARVTSNVKSVSLCRLSEMQPLPRSLTSIVTDYMYTEDFYDLIELPLLERLTFDYPGEYARDFEEFDVMFTAFIAFLCESPRLRYVCCPQLSTVIGRSERGMLRHSAEQIEKRAEILLEALGSIEIESGTHEYISTYEGLKLGGSVRKLYLKVQPEMANDLWLRIRRQIELAEDDDDDDDE